MRKLLIITISFMTLFETKCQPLPPKEVAQQLFDRHAAFIEPGLEQRRIKQLHLLPKLQKLKENPLFQVQVIGKSVQQRDLYLVKAGTGKTKVLLWSQMHGDESTATRALFDLFNFLQASDELDPIRKTILETTTLYIVPMLNPDGAEVFKRRNAQDIDLNRDALRLQSPEARLLKSLRDSLKPEFGFNLHDQSRYYSVGNTAKPATISFLAPPYDYSKTVNDVRGKAMRTIVAMNECMQLFIPGQVAKYSDEHEPRAFGDNIQKWGTSVILVESGGYHNDPEKNFIRQLNFVSITSALYMIGQQSYQDFKVHDYFKIPVDQRNLHDLLVRHVRFKENGRNSTIDIGIYRNEVNASIPQGFYYRSSIEEIGDLSVFHGYDEINGEGLTLVPGQVYETPFASLKDITPERARELLKEGYTTVKVEKLPKEVNPLTLPINVVKPSGKVSHYLALERMANFVLKDAEGETRYAIINGFVYDMQADKEQVYHGLVL